MYGIKIYQRSRLWSIFIFLPTESDKKSATATENHQALSRSLRVDLAKYAIIHSSTAPILHFKLITYMNLDRLFDLIVVFVFTISPQLGGLGPKSQDLVV